MLLHCNQGHENQTGSRFCFCCGEPLWLAKGHILEKRYRIVSQLGQGGFGRTYLAEDLHRFDERCVLKEFAPQVQGERDLQKAKDLFQREASALYKLKHPQLPQFREFFQAQLAGQVGCLFLAQDYVEGQTYGELLKSSKRLSETDVRQLICRLIPVLSYIHSQGVIHRDISPDNLILRRSDQLPVLIDFGGVKQVAATAIFKFTSIGQVPTRLGKIGYSPEEQLQQGQVFPNSDLYALAVTALVLLTGKEPQELYDIQQATWHWKRKTKVSSQLEAVLQKMLAPKPENRYQAAAEVLQDLSPTAPTPPDNVSQTPTVNFGGHKPDPQVSTQVISTSAAHSRWLRPWAVKVAGAGLIVLTTVSTWGLADSVIRSIRLTPFNRSSSIAKVSEKNRGMKIHNRLKVAKMNEPAFNAQVDRLFYAKHPELRGRRLMPGPKDAAFREEWYKIAEKLLAKAPRS